MERLSRLDDVPAHPSGSAVTIGFFDGVHRGHQEVVRRTVEAARRRALTSVAVTFDRHPREVYAPGTEPPLLTSLERKAALLEDLAVKELLVLAFSEELAAWSPQRFIDEVLTERLGARHVVVGSNFTFGHRALGTVATLRELGGARGFDVDAVGLLTLDGRRLSSSAIREAIAAGDLSWAARALGRRFDVDGVVTSGAGRGAGLGWPTANLDVPPRMLLPREGVYAGRANVEGGDALAAAINVGTNPTFGGEPLHVEAFLLDFDGDVRGRSMSVEFWERLRDEARFASAQELSTQIAVDVARTREIVGAPTRGRQTI